MTFKALPSTQLAVSPICLGTSELGTVLPEGDAFRLLDEYVDLGGNFLDSALVYANWIPGDRSISEKTIGRWLKARQNRADIVVATKGGHPELETMHIPRLSPCEIATDVNASLANLQVETVDLYYLHRDDAARPVGEILETLHDQVVAGKLRYIACSNWSADRINDALKYADDHGFQGFAANQMLWNLGVVDLTSLAGQGIVAMDKPLHQLHTELGLAAVPFSSQANGLFQKMAAGTLDRARPGIGRMYPLAENAQRFARIQSVAEECDFTVSQVVLGYLLSQPFTTVPIVGCKTMEHLRDTMAASEVSLDPALVSYLEHGVRPSEAGF